MSVTTSGLLREHAKVWTLGVRNPFLQGVRDGTLSKASLPHWLRQVRLTEDAMFTTFARVLAKAPSRDRPALIDGVRDSNETMLWIDARLGRRSAREDGIHPISRAYMDFLLATSVAPYAAGLTALWASRQAVVDDWAWARACAPPYRPFAARWTSKPFVANVHALRRAADAALREAGPGDQTAAADAFEQISRYEVDFWVMALERDAA